MKKYLLGLMFALSFATIGCTSKPILNVTGTPIVGKKSMKEIGETIERTLLTSNWSVDESKPGKITASLKRRSHVAKIQISYTDKSFDINHLESSGLDYDPDSNTIHRNYNRWIANLKQNLLKVL